MPADLGDYSSLIRPCSTAHFRLFVKSLKTSIIKSNFTTCQVPHSFYKRIIKIPFIKACYWSINKRTIRNNLRARILKLSGGCMYSSTWDALVRWRPVIWSLIGWARRVSSAICFQRCSFQMLISAAQGAGDPNRNWTYTVSIYSNMVWRQTKLYWPDV